MDFSRRIDSLKKEKFELNYSARRNRIGLDDGSVITIAQ